MTTPLRTLIGGIDHNTAADHVGRHSLAGHVRADGESPTQQIVRLAGADHRPVADRVKLHMQHHRVDVECPSSTAKLNT